MPNFMRLLGTKLSGRGLKHDTDHTWSMLDELDQLINLKARSTQNRYRGILRAWLKFLKANSQNGSLTFLNATFQDAERFVMHCKSLPAQVGRSEIISQKASDVTVRYKVTVLGSFYDHMIQCGLLSANPFARIKKQFRGLESGDRRPTEMTPFDLVAKIINQPNNSKEGVRDRAILALLYGGALRRGEVVSLRIQDCAETTAGSFFVRLRDTKTSNYEEQTLPEFAIPHVKALLEQRIQEGAQLIDPLFVTYTGEIKPSSRALSAATLYLLFKRYCRQAGCKVYVTPHSARATAITKLLEDGIPHREVKEFSRHCSVDMVERYDKRRKSVDEAVAKKLTFS